MIGRLPVPETMEPSRDGTPGRGAFELKKDWNLIVTEFNTGSRTAGRDP